ncbi:TMEM165/GDT1 family protein [Jongsikchunia kroppenstedtii]|uniref:TMEM165/GDT1 family protein n=1 Tax=Jongsikchunia kroppenstedtii TaxID=1121721 RepID=UPI0003694877|nr:TMEM165/GDT1 family protein [Jongsikchunia kroppenstedtii]
MLTALLVSFGVIFVAELGDKSQLMAMTYALKFRWWVVLAGITIATTLVHLVSVVVGHFMGLSIPGDIMAIVGGLAMLIFALWTLRGDRLDDDESGHADRVSKSVLLAVISSFFLAELGDKTMLATITLAADHDWAGVWIGSTVGMVAADALAIVVGATLGKHLPERAIALGAAALFAIFAAWLLAEGLAGASAPLIAVTVTALVAILAVGTWVIRRDRRRAVDTLADPATDLKTNDPDKLTPAP